jgi:hypothetical protein
MKTCELCDTRFTCDPNYTCWCMLEPLKVINPELHDCICPKCLKEAHDQETRRTVRTTS